eukprot:139429-Rhodomonas_salina.1
MTWTSLTTGFSTIRSTGYGTLTSTGTCPHAPAHGLEVRAAEGQLGCTGRELLTRTVVKRGVWRGERRRKEGGGGRGGGGGRSFARHCHWHDADNGRGSEGGGR